MADASTPLDWEEVARVYGRKIYNFAYRLTGNPQDADDLVQEVLLRVRRGLPGYRPGTFEGWLWRITRNAFLDDVRREQRKPTTSLPEDVDRITVGAAPSPEDFLSSIRLGDEMQQALLKLPIEFREAVVMCDVIGLSYQEISQAVEAPVGTVRSRIHRGRSMLKDLLPKDILP